MIKKLQHKLSKDANLKELLSGSAITFVIKITGMLIGYGVVLLVSRKYGAEGTGIYSLTTSLLNSLAIFGGLGLNIAVLRYVGQFNKAENGLANMKKLFAYIFQLAFPFAGLVGIGLFFLAEELAISVFGNPTYVPALKIGAVALPFFTLNLINVEFIRGLKALKVSEYLRSINRHIIVFILLIFSVLSYGVLDSIYALIFGVLISFSMSFLFILRIFKKEKTEYFNSDFSRKELLDTSLPMMVFAVFSFILAQSGTFFLEIYSSTTSVGVYSVALQLSNLVSLILIVINTISAPKFSELFWAGEMKQLQKIIFQSSKIIFVISLFASVVILIFSNFILGLFGNEFYNGFWPLLIMILGQMINAATGSVSVFLNMSGNHKPLRNIIFITSIVVISLNLILIPKYEIIGAAIVSFLGMAILNISAAIFTYRKLQFTTFYLPFLNKF